MVFEWYCDHSIVCRWGDHIFATYGVAMGCAAATFCATHVALLRALCAAAVLPSGFACEGFALLQLVAFLFGGRACSMQLEDRHVINQSVWRAALRPGMLSSGGQAFWVGTCLATAYACGAAAPWAAALALHDATMASFFAMMPLMKVGCVTYGCCWGCEAARAAWWTTVYTSPHAKVLQARADLCGRPLVPTSTLQIALFVATMAAGVLLARRASTIPVGTLTVVLPWVHTLINRAVYAMRGEGAPPEIARFTQQEQRRHRERWTRPLKALSLAGALSWTVALSPSVDVVAHLRAVAPASPASLSLAFLLYATAFGYHRGALGQWCVRRASSRQYQSDRTVHKAHPHTE